jgi:hypothetical protein
LRGRPLIMVRLGAVILLLASLSAAQAQPYPYGNDIGGIISWTPENEALARPAAQAHCAAWGKHARITSVYRQYGHYIGFECAFPRGYIVRERSTTIRVRG